MDSDARRKAQQRADRLRAFREELAELEREQALTLTAEQRAGLEAHIAGLLARLAAQFDVDVTESGKRISWGMRVASLLGGAAFCAAVVLFLHRIWGALTPTAHAVVLLAVPLLVLGGAELSFRRGVGQYYTALLALAAGVAFVVELSALGANFNLAPSAQALLAWGCFAVLAAYAYGLRLLLGGGLLLLCAYLGALLFTLQGGYWLEYLGRPELLLPGAGIMYAIASVAGGGDRNDFAFVYRLCGAGAAFTAILLLSCEGHFSYLRLAGRTTETLYQCAGLALSAGVVFHGLRLGRSGLVNLGALAFVVFLYVKLHAWWWAWMPKYLFFLLIGLIALGLLYLFRRIRAGVSGKVAP